MVEIGGEMYLTASAAAKYLGITRSMFYNNVKVKIRAYKLESRRRFLYKQSELEPFRSIQLVLR